MGNIKIEKMVLGMVQTNTWFVINEKTKELILIDPADDAGRIIRKIEAPEIAGDSAHAWSF